MHHPTRASWMGLLGAAMIAACQPAEPPERTITINQAQLEGDVAATESPARPAEGAVLAHSVAWGEGPEQLGVIEPGFETVATGPSAVALTAGGMALVLDRLRGRVVQIDGDGQVESLATVPVDAEELAIGRDGSLVVFSPLRATAWLYGATGDPAGEIRVPRVFRQLLHVELGGSHTVRLRTGYQELIDIGSPAAPLPLSVAMQTKKEGAVLLPDGRGVSVSVSGGRPELQIKSQGDLEQRSAVVARHPIDVPATAARIVGAFGRSICMRLERVVSTPELSVHRRVICVDVHSGDLTFERPLPAPGLYVPRRELSVGRGYLAFIHPTNDGLTLHRWQLARGAASTTSGLDPVVHDNEASPVVSEEVQP